MNNKNQWFAIYTRPKWEKKSTELLAKKQFESYCPLKKRTRKWSDRKKVILEPLFPSYVFVYTSESKLSEIKQVDGVVNVLYWLGKPAVIKEDEINAIKHFLVEYEDISLEKTKVEVNDIIRITSGPLTQMEGEVIEIYSKTIKVHLPSLGYIISAEVEIDNVELITYSENNIEYKKAI